jgi:predicted Zn-dependent protease
MAKVIFIPTNYDTAAARIDGVEYIALPVYEDAVIRAFRLPSGGADAIRGLLTLPNDAAEVYAASMAGIPDAEAVITECERILREEIAG